MVHARKSDVDCEVPTWDDIKMHTTLITYQSTLWTIDKLSEKRGYTYKRLTTDLKKMSTLMLKGAPRSAYAEC